MDSSPAFAAVVANLNDSGPGSLRQAVADAPWGDTITFAGGLAGTIQLDGGEIRIDKNLTIQGPAAALIRISGRYPSPGRVFSVGTVNGAVNVEISGVTIINGLAVGPIAQGGAVFNKANLTLRRVSVLNSFATADPGGSAEGGAIFNAGSLTMQGGEIAGHSALAGEGPDGGDARGGGVFNVGTAAFKDLKLELNLVRGGGGTAGRGGAALGGGLHNASGNVTLERVSVTLNTAQAGAGSSSGGEARGGAVAGVAPGELTMINSTLSGNAAVAAGGAALGGGAYLGQSSTLTNATVTDNRVQGERANGAGIFLADGAVATIGNTIIAHQNSGANCAGNVGVIGGSNNLQDPASATCGAGFASSATIGLRPLALNGGPIPTHQIQEGSAAIDMGNNNTCPASDERGAPRARVSADPCDIGAYERTPPQTFVVTKLTDTDSERCLPSDCSLREALQSTISGDIVRFAPGLVGTIALARGPLILQHDVTIEGPGPGALTLDGGARSRLINVGMNTSDHIINPAVVAAVSGLTLANGRAANGGAVYTVGSVQLSNVLIRDSRADGAIATGGGIDSRGGVLSVINSSIVNNVAQSRGGAASAAYGGGIASRANAGRGDVTLINVTVSGNTAADGTGENIGGGVYIVSDGSPVQSILNTTIANNAASGANAQAGGLFRYTAAALSVRNTLLDGNAANGAGANCGGTGPLSGGSNLQHGGAAGCPTESFAELDPMLEPLQMNGGSTPTHALAPASQAIDAGTDSGCPSVDQRGTRRPQGAHCDIGAVEGAGASANLEGLDNGGVARGR
ncbi:MAG: CSLREA domain-containing protein [Chloroflexota bacterium]